MTSRKRQMQSSWPWQHGPRTVYSLHLSSNIIESTLSEVTWFGCAARPTGLGKTPRGIEMSKHPQHQAWGQLTQR